MKIYIDTMLQFSLAAELMHMETIMPIMQAFYYVKTKEEMNVFLELLSLLEEIYNW
ncbi:hypothetical protein ACFLRY_00890 [Bacteroidota bacterium]